MTTTSRRPLSRVASLQDTERSVDRREGPVSLNGRAYRLQKRGRHAEAEPLLRRAVELKPDYAYANYNLGWSLVEQGKALEALRPLRRSAAMQPGRWEPYQRLSEAYALIGEAEKAAAFALRAQSLRKGRRSAASTPPRIVREQEPELELAPIVISK